MQTVSFILGMNLKIIPKISNQLPLRCFSLILISVLINIRFSIPDFYHVIILIRRIKPTTVAPTSYCMSPAARVKPGPCPGLLSWQALPAVYSVQLR